MTTAFTKILRVKVLECINGSLPGLATCDIQCKCIFLHRSHISDSATAWLACTSQRKPQEARFPYECNLGQCRGIF